MVREAKRPEELTLIGGKLCLDFTNTVDWHASDLPQENLHTYEDFVKWSCHAGILNEDESRTLLSDAKKRYQEAKKMWNQILELREILYRIFSATAAGNDPKKKDLDLFNKHLSRTMVCSRLVTGKDECYLDTNGDKDCLDWPLRSIVRSAAELLVSHELNRVKMCADDRGCGWLFIDGSRNKSRCWCDMSNCGNRAKAKRFYHKKD